MFKVASQTKLLTFALSAGIVLMLSGVSLQVVSAANVQVQASVPYPAPSQPAIFHNGLDGKTVHDALVTLNGTCQIQNPADAVVVQRGGTTLGSTVCISGTFSVQVMLAQGVNILIAKTINTSMLEGPDSQPITIILVLPPSITPTPNIPNPTAPASTPDAVTVQTNSGVAADLTVVPSEPLSTLSANKEATISITIDGGNTPYTILLNWGDGTTESHAADKAGLYSFTHTYDEAGNYKVRGTVHDVLGATTVFEHAVMSSLRTGTTVFGQAGDKNAQESLLRRYAAPIAGTVGLAALLGIGYWFGAHHAVAQLLGSSQSAARKSTAFRSRRHSYTKKHASRRQR